MYAALGIFFALNLVVGLAQKKAKTLGEWALAGRSMGTGVLMITVLATVIGAKYVTVRVTDVQEFGMSNRVIVPLAYMVTILSLGHFVYPALLRFNKCYTLGDVMGRVYGREAQLVTGILSLLASLLYIVAQFVLMGYLCSMVRLNKGAIILMVGLVVTSYTVLGGLRSVAATDVVQFILVVGGFLFIANKVLNTHYEGHGEVHSVEELLGKVYAHKPYRHLLNIWETPHFMMSVLAGFFLCLGGFISAPVIQRVLSFRNEKQLRTAFTGAACFIFVLGWVLGVIGLGLLLAYGPSKITEEKTFDVIATYLFHDSHQVRILLILMLSSVVMSTTDSWLNSSVILICCDVLPFFNDKKARSDDEEPPIVITIGLGITVTLLSYLLQEFSVVSIIAFVDLNLCFFLVPLVAITLRLPGDKKAFFASLGTFLFLAVLLGSLGQANIFFVGDFEEWKHRFFRRKFFFVVPFALIGSGIAYMITHYMAMGDFKREEARSLKKSRYSPIGQKEGALAHLFRSPVFWARRKMVRYGSNPFLLGAYFSIANLFLFSAIGPQMMPTYRNIFFFVRCISLLFSVMLMIAPVWREPFRYYFPLFWFVSLIWLLPFYSALQLLYNPGNKLVVLQFLIAITLLQTLIDGAASFFIAGVGFVMAALFYYCTAITIEGSAISDWWFIVVGLATMVAATRLLFLQRAKTEETNLLRNEIFARTFAHDISNTLMGLNWTLHDSVNRCRQPLLAEKVKKGEAWTDEDKEEFIAGVAMLENSSKMIKRQADAFSGLVLNDGIQEKDVHPTDVVTFLKKHLLFFKQDYNMTVKLVEGPSFKIAIHDTLLASILANLVKNAYFHGGAKEIKIGWNAEAKSIIVTDNGVGIADHVVPHLFEGDIFKGTGVGLVSAQQILGMMGATIGYVPREKKGATFVITFPPLGGTIDDDDIA